MTEAEIRIPWLPSCATIARVACYLGCAPEAAELQIVSKGKGGRIKTRGVIETRPVSPLPAAWNGTVDLAGATMKPPEASYEIANLELCCIDLVAAGLLPAPVERARWPAGEAIAYLVAGVPLPWKEWQRAGASPADIERAEIDLGQVISEGVPAWGWHPLERRRKQIPSDHFRDEMIEKKAVPVSVARQPKVVVDCAGHVTIAPRQRSADYQGPRWQAVEVDAAALRQARPRSVIARAEPVIAGPAPAASAAPPVNRGGRPTDRDLVLEEASWRLRHRQHPETLAAFARELRKWLGDHGEHRAVITGEVMKAKTIEDHVRPMWNAHKRAQVKNRSGVFR
jgi:hypothetical protein